MMQVTDQRWYCFRLKGHDGPHQDYNAPEGLLRHTDELCQVLFEKSVMTFAGYQTGVMRTAGETGQRARLNAALGLGESGEVQNIVKKEVFHGHPEDRMAILDELGDILYYVAWLAREYDIDLELVAQFNQDKLKARYPDGFDKERSINRE